MSLRSGTLPSQAPFERKPRHHGTRYSHVAAATDTGASASKLGPADSARQIVRKQAEKFKRVKPHQLARSLVDIKNAEENIYAIGGDDEDDAPISTHVSVCDPTAPASSGCDVLVLDLRDPDDYDACHIEGAKSYPRQLIVVHDKITPELYRFKASCVKNHASKKLVVYDTDEKATCRMANLLIEKEFANVYMVSGGFENIVTEAPGILVGTPPPVVAPTVARSLASPQNGRSSAMLSTTRRKMAGTRTLGPQRLVNA